MTEPLFETSALASAVQALRKDLLAEGGPQISTMRNYRFAILPYDPRKEFELRRYIRHLSDELRSKGWNVLALSLQRLLLDRLKAEEPRVLDSITRTEQRLFSRHPERGLNYLKDKIAPYIEGQEGIASDVIQLIGAFADAHPDDAERTVIFLGRAGALYPFFRSSALLKHIDGKTRQIPVVLLYPGERGEGSALSFMGELPADRDYRPRIYT
jgi:BREX protein BrxB